MSLTLTQKQQVVQEVQAVAQQSVSVLVAHYRGLTVDEMTELRQKARADQIHIRVVRNTLAKRALAETPFSGLHPSLIGPTFLAFSEEAPGAAARLVQDFIKTHDNLKVQAIAIGDQVLPAEQLESVAKLPTRDEALTRLASVMKAPVAKLPQTLSAVIVKLAQTLSAVAEQKKQTS